MLARAQFRTQPHVLCIVYICQAVLHQTVYHGNITQLNAGTTAREVVGNSAHVFHAASHDDLCIAGLYSLCSHHHGLHSRRTNFVDGGGRDVTTDTSKNGGLTRRGLSYIGL